MDVQLFMHVFLPATGAKSLGSCRSPGIEDGCGQTAEHESCRRTRYLLSPSLYFAQGRIWEGGDENKLNSVYLSILQNTLLVRLAASTQQNLLSSGSDLLSDTITWY